MLHPCLGSRRASKAQCGIAVRMDSARQLEASQPCVVMGWDVLRAGTAVSRRLREQNWENWGNRGDEGKEALGLKHIALGTSLCMALGGTETRGDERPNLHQIWREADSWQLCAWCTLPSAWRHSPSAASSGGWAASTFFCPGGGQNCQKCFVLEGTSADTSSFQGRAAITRTKPGDISGGKNI